MTAIIENIPKADCPAANAVHAGVSASWESLMPLLLADDQKAPDEHAGMFMVRQFARLQFSDTVDLRAEYKKRFFVPCPEYISRDDLIFELIKRIHLEHYTPDAVCTHLNTDDPVEYARQVLLRAGKYDKIKLPHGIVLVREYKRKKYEVFCLSSCFLYDGFYYKSLTEISHLITKTQYSGPSFFKKKTHIDELKEFLRIPSISTMPEHAGDIHRAAEWLQGNFSAMGGTEVEIHETPKHPIVTARFGNDPSKPTVLVYGHYDVQPAGNPEEWTTPAFEPDVRNGMIYARGAVDDKGQVFAHLKALEFLQQQGGELPCNMLYVIEGEEEIGSPNLRGFVDAHKEMLACDAIVISDTAVLGEDLPAMTVGLRGATFIRVKVSGPTTELHSGLYGGAVTDPNIALAKMIAGMTDENNRITIPGFYDGIKEHSPEARAAINAQPHDDEAYKAKLGVDALTGENGFTPLERTGIRPSFTVHGIQSGPPVNTLKPVIAPFAEATMSLRLVSGQDPKGMGDRMGEYLASLAPKGVVVTHKMLLEASPWSKTSDAAADQVAADSFGRVWGKRPIPVYSGGAIPVVPVFEELLGASPVMMGFGLHEDGLHAPNEHFGISRLQKGIATLVDFFQNFPAAHAAGKAESRPVVQ